METNAVARPACASCKHQRKKCQPSCVLAPFFPAEKTQKFLAVHKVFGVSNVLKMIRSIRPEDRSAAAESLIWEAECRLRDPVNGCWGEYMKVCNELQRLKVQASKPSECSINSNPMPCYHGYGILDDGLLDYASSSGNMLLEQACMPGLEKAQPVYPIGFSTDRSAQDYTYPDQFNKLDINPSNAGWEGTLAMMNTVNGSVQSGGCKFEDPPNETATEAIDLKPSDNMMWGNRT